MKKILINQIEKVRWPESLTTLSFNGEFNQPIEKIKWPESLTNLTFSHDFNQPIENIEWPKSLSILAFGTKFNQYIDFLPESLKELTIKETFKLNTYNLPHNLNCIKIHYINT